MKLFIDLGWHTVPLEGELRRLEDGKKTIPLFPKNWNKIYTENFNTKITPIGGAMTGKVSGIVAIDCDTEKTWNLFRSLDANYEFVFRSKGKGEECGTIIYKYIEGIPSFRAEGLDFFSDGGFIYLPTKANQTKHPWDYNIKNCPELKEAPESVVALLKLLATTKTIAGQTVSLNKRITTNYRLAPLVIEFVESKEYIPALFKIITPKQFREHSTYKKIGHLHPNEIPMGQGSTYLSQVSAILGADPSIDEDLYTKAIKLINQLWENPMPAHRLEATIIKPMLTGQAKINGEAIWTYDEYWQQIGFVATALNGDFIESFFDDQKGIFYLINYTKNYTKAFTEKRACISTIKALTGRKLTEEQYDKYKSIINSVIEPTREFGHLENDQFNLFRRSYYLEILNNPSLHKDNYKEPVNTIKFLKSLVPNDKDRLWLLRFIRTKFTTFKYSPIILYFIGAQGSGKDTLFSLLTDIIGIEYTAKPDTKVFCEQYNGWLMDKFLVQLDEYGNKLTSNAERNIVLGKLKSYSGSPQIQIRAMRQDGFNYWHSCTFVLTANNNPLPLEIEDRRIAFFLTPNRLDRQPFVSDISQFVSSLKEELTDFCYWLATNVENLSSNEYMIAPETVQKQKIVLDSQPAYKLLVHLITQQKFEELDQLFKDYNVADYDTGWQNGRLMHDPLAELYNHLTEGQGSVRVLVKALKDVGFKRYHTTHKSVNIFYYIIDGLEQYYRQTRTEFGELN